MKPFNAIAAVDKNFAIGYNGDLLFHNRDDMANFKRITLHNTVIMGRKTYESIGSPLLERTNIILTHEPDKIEKKGLNMYVFDIEQFWNYVKKYQENNYYIIGGGSIYKKLLCHTNRIILTHIDKVYPNADTFFPRIDKIDKWVKRSKILSFTDDTDTKIEIWIWNKK